MEERKKKLIEMKICRFCFSSDESQLSNIYQKEAKTIPLTMQIMSCVSIEVFPNDGLPPLICNTCKNQTYESYVFKSNCKKADDALKNFLQTGKLVQPSLQKPQDSKKRPASKVSPLKDVKIVSEKSPAPDEPKVKKVKLNDGTEVITLVIQEPENIPEKEEEIAKEEPQNNETADLENEDEEFIDFSLESDIFCCKICDRTFPLKQLLEIHEKNYHRERQFACPTCNMQFFTKHDMKKHQQVHSEKKPFSCSICNKEFMRVALLRRHEQIHQQANKYLCPVCEKAFIQKDDLKNHMKKHEKKRPHTCEICDKSFVFKQGLERHMTSVHAQEQPHTCNYCNASFSSTIRLTRHITSHAGLRPYPCKICGRTFLLSHHLTRHMRSHFVEGGRQPEVAIGQHRCDICSMSFRRKDSLINHSAIHSMVNLRCVICNTSFETAKMVQEHITTHLQGLPFPCEQCDYSFETNEQLEEHELKHAEMEYEKQIEQEVLEEVKNQTEGRDYNEYSSEEEVEEYHISNIENATIVPKRKDVLYKDSDDIETYEIPLESITLNEQQQIFKTEVEFDSDEPEDGDADSSHVTGENEVDANDGIKPIIRSEGTKVYERKGPIQRKLPQVEKKDVEMALPEEINEPANVENITGMEDALSNLPSEKPVKVKVGDKVVKVQKFIISKEEMKHMAKMGILEVKRGQVTVKTPGQPILNATIKPIQQSDFESLLGQKKTLKPPSKQYRGNSLRRVQDSNIMDD